MKRLVCCLVLAVCMLAGCSRQQETKTLYHDSAITVTRVNGALYVKDNSAGQTYTIQTRRVKRDPDAVKAEKTLAQSDTVKIETVFDVVRITEVQDGKTVCVHLR